MIRTFFRMDSSRGNMRFVTVVAIQNLPQEVNYLYTNIDLIP